MDLKYFAWKKEQEEDCECGKCDDCICKAELAYENYLEGYYGGSQPITLKEKQETARKLK